MPSLKCSQRLPEAGQSEWCLKFEKYWLLTRPTRNLTGQKSWTPEVTAILSRGCSNFNDTHSLTVIYELSHTRLFQETASPRVSKEAWVLIFESIQCARLDCSNTIDYQQLNNDSDFDRWRQTFQWSLNR